MLKLKSLSTSPEAGIVLVSIIRITVYGRYARSTRNCRNVVYEYEVGL